MRSWRMAGGGTGTSLVRSRLDPSALYWYLDANEALTVETFSPAVNPVIRLPPRVRLGVDHRSNSMMLSSRA